MTYLRRNSVGEQEEACQKARQLTALCEQLHIALDPIDWQEDGMRTPVKVDNIEIASLLDLSQRESDDVLRLIQLKLFERAALESIHARPGLRASMWSPVDVVQPQAFLSLWVITLETEERIPIIESIKDGRRVYERYSLDPGDGEQLARLFGPSCAGEYHVGDKVTVKERECHYSGEIIYIIPPGKVLTGRKYTPRGYRTAAGAANTNDIVARYIVDCNDGFPHIVYQSQIVE
jgi:hypothetical protein